MTYTEMLREVQTAMFHYIAKDQNTIESANLKHGLMSFQEMMDVYSKHWNRNALFTITDPTKTGFPPNVVETMFNRGFRIQWMKDHGYIK